MSKTVKVGFIGCGGIANGKHMPSLKKVPGVQMVAFCDLVVERAEKAAREYGTPDAKVYTDAMDDRLASKLESALIGSRLQKESVKTALQKPCIGQEQQEDLREFLDKYKPRYLIHGHVHMTYGHNIPRVLEYNGTSVINAYERYVLEIPEREVAPKYRDRLYWLNGEPNLPDSYVEY